METICIIQARLSSTRFPRKIIQPIWNKMNSLDILIHRLKLCEECEEIDKIVIATTTNPADDELVKMYEGKVSIFRGSEDDVFDRITQATLFFSQSSSDIIIEVTSDCPFVCPKQLGNGLLEYKIGAYDYLSNAIIRNFPVGFDFQIYKAWMLDYLNYRIPNINHKIHGGWNLVNYSMLLYAAERDLKYGHYYAAQGNFHPDWRIVLDYPEDLLLLQEIMKRMNRLDFTAREVISLIDSEPQLLEINKNCKQKIAGMDKVGCIKTKEELRTEYDREVIM